MSTSKRTEWHTDRKRPYTFHTAHNRELGREAAPGMNGRPRDGGGSAAATSV